MILIVTGSGEQPYHLRITAGGNSKTLVSGETLKERSDAFIELEAVARALGIANAAVNMRGDRFYLTGGDHPVEITFRDERPLEERTR